MTLHNLILTLTNTGRFISACHNPFMPGCFWLLLVAVTIWLFWDKYLHRRQTNSLRQWVNLIFNGSFEQNNLVFFGHCWHEWVNPIILRLLPSKAKGCKDYWKPPKPCHVRIHWKALTVHFQISTHVPRLQSFFRFSASFCIGQYSHQAA